MNDLNWFRLWPRKGGKMIVPSKKGFYVVAENGNRLGGPYPTRGEAEKRLRQVEYWKPQKK